MPRLSLYALSARSRIILAGVVVLGALLGVLYVILSGPVHAPGRIPPALARLKPEKTPKPAPGVAFSDAEGRRHLLSEFKGRYVLVNLWATWCAPCVRELPALARLQAAVPAKQLKVIAVNVGRSNAKETAAFLEAHHADALGVWLDTDMALVRTLDAYGLPTSVLIDPEGREVARAVGASDWDAPSAVNYFRALPVPQLAPGRKSKPARAHSLVNDGA